MTRATPADHENPPSPPFAKGGLGGFESYFLIGQPYPGMFGSFCCLPSQADSDTGYQKGGKERWALRFFVKNTRSFAGP